MQPLFGDPEHTLYLVDVSSFIFRAFFAIRPLHTHTGEPVNAVYGVATMLARIAQEAKPQYLAVTYDSKEPSFREEIYPEYKANRSEPPDDLIPQFSKIEELIRHFEIHSYRKAGVEADDLIATLTQRWLALAPENHVVIVSSDKDLMQLVNGRVKIWDTMSNKIYGSAEVQEKLGVKPSQVRDYLALVGDSSDNIPGVPGVGPKTASELLEQFGDLNGVLKAAAEGWISGKRAQTIQAHDKEARLSAELASVKGDLDLHVARDDFRYRFHVNDECRQFLLSMDFHTLVKRWTQEVPEITVEGAASNPEPVQPAEQPQIACPEKQEPPADWFRTVHTEDAFEELLRNLERAKEFAFDLETTSLNPREAIIVGIAISHDPSFGCYIPLNHRQSLTAQNPEQLPEERVLSALKPFFQNPRYKKIGQNLKYDSNVLASYGIEVDGIGADTMVAAYVLDPEGRRNLEALSQQYLNYQVLTYEEVCGKGKDQLCFDEVPIALATRYAAEDALIALRLWHKLRERLQEERLMDVFAQVDLPLVRVLSRMEREGVCIDTSWLSSLSQEFQRELKAIEERIQAFTKGPINLNSPKQLATLLFEDLKLPTQSKTKTGYSTDASVLEALAPLHEVPRLLLEYREIAKLKGTYVDPLPLLRDKKTGKIHASFHQAVTATGRLSSSDPNLQNIPIRSERGRKIRRAFVPCEGNLLVAADYSQIELRLLAHMSGDPELVRAFQQEEDVHQRTASELFRIPAEQVDDRQRSIAKAINFGLMYGKTAFGLSQELKIPRKEAQEIIQRYFERYSSVKRFLDQQIEEARTKGYVSTLLGRKRKLPDIQSRNPAVRANAERMAMNSPIQGTAADLMKLAMIELDDAIQKRGLRSRLIIQVHDEVVLDCPKEEAPEVQTLVCQVMEGAMKLNVPLRVNSAVGENWMDL